MPYRRHRVLVLAEHCNPEWVSIPLEGWSHFDALSRAADVHLVTQIRNRDAIVRAGLIEGRDFTAIDSEAVARPMTRLSERLRGGSGRGWTTVTAVNSLSLFYFSHVVKKTFASRLKAGEFDLVHQLTPLSPTHGPPIAAVCRKLGVPFVWGPINGGLPWPKGFAYAMRQEREWLSLVRGAHKYVPGYRAARRNASAIIVGSSDAKAQLDRKFHEKAVFIEENGVDPRRFQIVKTREPSLPIRIVFLGRLVPYKGGDMLIEAAMPMLRDGTVTIDFIGTGPHLPQLQKQVDDANLPNVTFVGSVNHRDLAARLATYDVLGFPSIREFGGAVAIEAMALGVVPIVPAYGGLGDLVSPETGFLVPMGSRDEIVRAYRDVLRGIVADPDSLVGRAERGRRRVADHFTWDRKAAKVLKVYDWVLGRAPKPEFPLPTPDDRPAVSDPGTSDDFENRTGQNVATADGTSAGT